MRVCEKHTLTQHKRTYDLKLAHNLRGEKTDKDTEREREKEAHIAPILRIKLYHTTVQFGF